MRSPNRAEYDLVEGLRDSYEKDFGRGTFRKPADFSVDDMILERERANEKLRDELLKYVGWCQELDCGRLPDGFQDFIEKQVEG